MLFFPQQLAWSFTKRKLWRTCRRAFYWQYLGSRGGAYAKAGTLARRSWTLKQTTSLPLLVGVVVHEAGRQLITAIRDRSPIPSFASLRDGAAFTMNQVWVTSTRQLDRFWQMPGVYTAFREVVNRGAIRESELEMARWKLASALQHLYGAPLLDDLRLCQPAEIIVGDGRAQEFRVDSDLHVTAAVDLAYLHHSPATCRNLVSSSCWCVADLKTAQVSDIDSDRLQLSAYCLWLKAIGKPMTAGIYLGRIVDLLNGTDTWYGITEHDLSMARTAISRDLDEQRALLDDPARMIPKAAAEFALTSTPRTTCPHCAFLEICTKELGRRPWSRPWARRA